VFPAASCSRWNVSKLKYYDDIVPLFKTGKLTPTSVIAQGTAHIPSVCRAKGSKVFSRRPTNWFTMVPTIYNADTLGIRPDLSGADQHLGRHHGPAFKGKTPSSACRRSASWTPP